MTRRPLLLLLVGVASLLAQVKPLTILHSNDLHAHMLPDDLGRGGFARLATAIREERAKSPAALYLNAGDLVQGTPVSTFFHGTPVYELANLLGIDAATIGNHEFDYGWRRVQEFGRIATYPLLSANVVDAKGETLTGHPFVIKTVGGIRVAIIGVVLGDLSGVYVVKEQVEPWKVLPVVETVRRYARQLREQSDLIIVLGHFHDKTEVRAILEQVPEVCVVVAGHNHDAYKTMMNVDGRVAVLVDGLGLDLGRLDLQVDTTAKKLKSAEWKKIPIDAKYAEDAAVKKLVDNWESKVSKVVDVPVGESTARMEREDPVLRKMVETAMKEQTGADIAWVNTGNIRDVLPKGRITLRNLWNLLPFDDYIVLGKFRGRDLPPAITRRYPVDPGREYLVATTDFTAANQEAKEQFNTTGLKFPQTGPVQRDAVIEWVKKKKIVP